MGSVSLTVHLFDTQEQAESALQTVNTGEGYSAGTGDVTTSYTAFYPTEDGRYYIVADDVTSKYLTEETTIQVTTLDYI